jgi:hypothetical protein
MHFGLLNVLWNIIFQKCILVCILASQNIETTSVSSSPSTPEAALLLLPVQYTQFSLPIVCSVYVVELSAFFLLYAPYCCLQSLRVIPELPLKSSNDTRYSFNCPIYHQHSLLCCKGNPNSLGEYVSSVSPMFLWVDSSWSSISWIRVGNCRDQHTLICDVVDFYILASHLFSTQQVEHYCVQQCGEQCTSAFESFELPSWMLYQAVQLLQDSGLGRGESG